MKSIDHYSGSALNTIAASIETSYTEIEDIRSNISDMFQLPPPDRNRKSVLDEIFEEFTSSAVDYCDNNAQFEVLRHHYLNEFGLEREGEEEVVKDYNKDSIIHKVVDDTPSTFRGPSGAVHAWHELHSYLQGPCHFELHHISVCRNHAQVDWTAETSKPKQPHLTIHGTDAFTFDDSNHITMQTTVALSDKGESSS